MACRAAGSVRGLSNIARDLALPKELAETDSANGARPVDVLGPEAIESLRLPTTFLAVVLGMIAWLDRAWIGK